MTDPAQAEVIDWLAGRSERRIDTACAHVFLAETTAWKLKRPVDLGYADFSTPERRRWALDREAAFNRATAPDIYRAVRRITRAAGGGVEFDGPGAVLEHVLEMRRFDDRAVLAARPEAVDGDLADALGRAVAAFHAAAPPRPDGGLPAVAFTVASNAELLRGRCPGLDPARVDAALARVETEARRQAALIGRRAADGFARRCHGDLHLGNILLEAGRPVLFDCIEFSDLLSDIDVQYDLAFLLMDLEARGRRDAAARVLSAYLDEAARDFPPALWDGLAALPLMLAVRACVRAHVSAHSGERTAAHRYLDAAVAALTPAPPVLVAVGGLSGAGKSVHARAVAPALGRAPGAVILRTDEVRKRLLGLAPTAPAPAEAYRPDLQARTYEAMFAAAGALLRAGQAVVLDATFISPESRRRAEALAAAWGVAFRPVWLEAPTAVRAERVATRRGDASDATVALLPSQAESLVDAAVDWPRIDGTHPV